MDLNLSPSEEQFRDEFREWLTASVPPKWTSSTTGDEARGPYFDYLVAWQRKLYEGGWTGISWPKAYGGRDASLMEQAIFNEEMARAEAPPLINVLGLSLIGPTIITAGTEEQKKRFIPKIL